MIRAHDVSRIVSGFFMLEAAVNGQVSALVTHNVRDFSAAAPKFSLQVLTPAQLILTMEKKT
jgi:hypothetical protein